MRDQKCCAGRWGNLTGPAAGPDRGKAGFWLRRQHRKAVWMYSFTPMQARVVRLFNAGSRRPREDCRNDPGVVGELLVRAIPAANGRAVLHADLFERMAMAATRPLLPSLIDARLCDPERTPEIPLAHAAILSECGDACGRLKRQSAHILCGHWRSFWIAWRYLRDCRGWLSSAMEGPGRPMASTAGASNLIPSPPAWHTFGTLPDRKPQETATNCKNRAILSHCFCCGMVL